MEIATQEAREVTPRWRSAGEVALDPAWAKAVEASRACKAAEAKSKRRGGKAPA